MSREPSVPLTCRICGMEFASRRELETHTKSEHPEYARESKRLLMLLLLPFTSSVALGMMHVYFQNVDPNLASTLLVFLLIDVAILFLLIYRGYRLPQKYKKVYQHSVS